MIQSLSNDFLIRLKNGSLAQRKTITAPSSKFCVSLAEIVKKYGYIEGYEVSDGPKKTLTIKLAYKDGAPVISNVKLFSRPGRRLYEKKSTIPWGQTKGSLIIVSTSSGVKSQKEASKLGLGGELIAEIY